MSNCPAPFRRAASRVALAVLALLLPACASRGARPDRLEPALAVADARSLAVYRTIADSVYVATTERPIAVVATSLDSACTAAPCTPLAERWGVGSLWWSVPAGEDAESARRDLLARGATRFDLRPVTIGARALVTIAPDRVPILGSDVAPWIAFRDGNSAAAGAVHFSPVGFSRTGRSALVYVDWRCGPACGHTLSVALEATSDSTWRIGDMLLLSSRQR